MSVRSSKATIPPWPSDAAGGHQLVEVQPRVEQRRRQQTAERPADLQRLDRVAVAQPAGEVEAQLAQRHAEAHLVDAGAREALVEADELRARGRAGGAQSPVVLGAAARDDGDVAERLDVVDHGHGVLAGDVRSLDDRHVEAEVRAEDAAAEQAGAARDRRRPLERRLGARVLRARDHDAVLGADREAGQRHALQQQVGVLLHQDLVDVGARVALVAVGDDQRPVARRVASAPPAIAGRPAVVSAPADGRGLDLGEQLLGRQHRDGARQAGPGGAEPEQHRLVQRAARGRLPRGSRRAREHALDDARPGVDDVAVAHRRRAVAEAQAGRLGERDRAVGAALAQLAAQALAQRVDMGAGRRREAGGPGADADVAPAVPRRSVRRHARSRRRPSRGRRDAAGARGAGRPRR